MNSAKYQVVNQESARKEMEMKNFILEVQPSSINPMSPKVDSEENQIINSH